ncbi:hypothetical protein HD599_001403 [Conyzicola lurida]|uniref:SGNH hydrolase-type esterase domain-containing protein n=1 Tax=Conyzicola lurida TaxID=1172621 RepID=A0A841AGX5_9MICO|nr:SGNH/GDSL hydrolase family protein [Conyzicola lurida]MBB5843080.1 hypothetical protein [Conyzicola lurida]
MRDAIAHRIVNALGRPFVRVWLASAEMSAPWLPRPDGPGAPQPEHDADRLLLVGNGAAVGYGVLTHDLSLAGHLGRQLTVANGRPAHVSVLADGSMTWGSAAALLPDAHLDPYDAIVLTVGVNEALGLASAEQVRRACAGVLDYLASPRAPKLRIIVVGIPPLRSISSVPPSVEWLVDRHAAVLNSVVSEVCGSRDLVTFVPFAPEPGRDRRRYRSTETYREWAALIVPATAEALARECPTGSAVADDDLRHPST